MRTSPDRSTRPLRLSFWSMRSCTYSISIAGPEPGMSTSTPAVAEGFHVILTNDARQMQRPREVEAIATSGLHRIEYPHKHPGLIGIGLAIATVAAGLPTALALLAEADGQRLVVLRGIDPAPASRLRVVDPAIAPPKYWPDLN
jgi:hypothetical protein